MSIPKNNKVIRGLRSKMQYLLEHFAENNYGYWYMVWEEGKTICDIFWALPIPSSCLTYISTVLVNDSMYKTNKSMIPLLEIVGVTST